MQLHRYANGWVATGARAADVEVDSPLPFARIPSPVTVAGRSVAYEGTVSVTVTEDRRGPDRVLGRGFVGGVAELAPFSGRIAFARPTGDAGLGGLQRRHRPRRRDLLGHGRPGQRPGAAPRSTAPSPPSPLTLAP